MRIYWSHSKQLTPPPPPAPAGGKIFKHDLILLEKCSNLLHRYRRSHLKHIPPSPGGKILKRDLIPCKSVSMQGGSSPTHCCYLFTTQSLPAVAFFTNWLYSIWEFSTTEHWWWLGGYVQKNTTHRVAKNLQWNYFPICPNFLELIQWLASAQPSRNWNVVPPLKINLMLLMANQ